MDCEDKSKGEYSAGPDQTGTIPGAAGQGHAHNAEHATGIPSQVGMYGAAMDRGGMDHGTGRPGPDMGQPHYAAGIPGAPPYQGAPVGGPWVQPGNSGPFMGQAVPGANGAAGQQGGSSGCDCGKDSNPDMAGNGVSGGHAPSGYAPGYAPQGAMGPQGYAPAGHFPPGRGTQFQQPSAPWAPEHGPHAAPYYAPHYPTGPRVAGAPYGPPPGMPFAAPHAHHDGPSNGHGAANRYGELYGLIREAANGQPDVSRFLNFFQTVSSDFWKGALVGTGLTLLLTNDVVKGMLSKNLAGLWGMAGASAEEQEAEEDRKAEEQAAKEGRI